MSETHRRQTDSILASLIRHGVLFADEFDVTEVYDHVRSNGPDDPTDPIGFDEVIRSLAGTVDPLTNLVFIPTWSELTLADIEEFAESICWLAGINTSAVALSRSTQPQSTQPRSTQPRSTQPQSPARPVDPVVATLRFELEPGCPTELELTLVAKGIPAGLIDGLAALLDDRLAPRRIAEALSGGDLVISALDADTLTAINSETDAGFVPSSRGELTGRAR